MLSCENKLGRVRRLFGNRAPIIIASACIGIAGQRLNWGLGLSLAVMALVQLFLVSLSYR
jgi:hypothetical protein